MTRVPRQIGVMVRIFAHSGLSTGEAPRHRSSHPAFARTASSGSLAGPRCVPLFDLGPAAEPPMRRSARAAFGQRARRSGTAGSRVAGQGRGWRARSREVVDRVAAPPPTPRPGRDRGRSTRSPSAPSLPSRTQQSCPALPATIQTSASAPATIGSPIGRYVATSPPSAHGQPNQPRTAPMLGASLTSPDPGCPGQQGILCSTQSTTAAGTVGRQKQAPAGVSIEGQDPTAARRLPSEGRARRRNDDGHHELDHRVSRSSASRTSAPRSAAVSPGAARRQCHAGWLEHASERRSRRGSERRPRQGSRTRRCPCASR